jgi:hypothetical protein
MRWSTCGDLLLEQDFGCGLVLAALAENFDAEVQVCLAVRELLGEVQRVAGLDENVQAPAHDLLFRVGHCLQYISVRKTHADPFLAAAVKQARYMVVTLRIVQGSSLGQWQAYNLCQNLS